MLPRAHKIVCTIRGNVNRGAVIHFAGEIFAEPVLPDRGFRKGQGLSLVTGPPRGIAAGRHDLEIVLTDDKASSRLGCELGFKGGAVSG